MTPRYEPLRITAHLQSGIASSAPWGVALDGLLASEIWSTEKARRRASNEPTPGLHAQTDPPDLDLPLARCETTDDHRWHWHTTTAYPLDHDRTVPPQTRYWSAYVDQHAAARLAARTPATVSARRGRWRMRRIPTLATICTSVTWTAVGERDELIDLLTPVAAIGKHRGTGEGHVLAWDVTPAPELDRFTAGHLHPDGTLGRPTPPDCLKGSVLAATPARGLAGIRPPYMHRSRQYEVHLPTFLETADAD